MAMQDYLEQDREQLSESLRQAGTAEKAAEVLHKELDYLLLRHNEQCSIPAERDAAAYMIQSLQLAVPFVDTIGETRVWERTDNVRKDAAKKMSKWQLALLAGTAVCLAGALGISIGQMKQVSLSGVILLLAFMAGGTVCAFFLGSRQPKKAGRNDERQQQVEVRPDTEKIVRQLRTAILAIDRNLLEVGREEAFEQSRAQAEAVHAGDPAEWELLSGFLEALYSEDGQYALDQCGQVRHYLHRRGIETVDYSEETKAMFDFLPSMEAGTIRPALVSGGKVLKKGLASKGLR